VAGLWILVAAMNCFYIVPSGILSVVMAELSIGPTAASALVSVMFGTQVLVGVPAGLAVDRLNSRVGLAGATAVLLVAFVLSWQAAAAGAFWWLLAARGVATAAIAAIWTASVNVTGRLFPPDRRATAVGVVTGSPVAGFALGLVTGPVLAEWLGWSAVFVAYSVPALAGCGLFLAATRGADLHGGDLPTPALGDVRTLLSNRAVWTVATMSFLAYSVFAFVTTWVPTYLTESLGLTLASGGLLAATFPAIGVVARGASGVVSDRLFGQRRRPVALLAFIVTAPSLVVLFVSGSVPVVAGALVLAGLFVQLGQGLFFAQARELSAPNVAATAVGFTTSLGTLGGFVAPLAGGLLVERAGYGAAFTFAVCLAGLGVVVASWTPDSGN
jgi:predicted MFS family arabinose efflux permease